MDTSQLHLSDVLHHQARLASTWFKVLATGSMRLAAGLSQIPARAQQVAICTVFTAHQLTFGCAAQYSVLMPELNSCAGQGRAGHGQHGRHAAGRGAGAGQPKGAAAAAQHATASPT